MLDLQTLRAADRTLTTLIADPAVFRPAPPLAIDLESLPPPPRTCPRHALQEGPRA